MNFKYVDNTLSTFNIANVSTRLTGVHGQQTLYMGLFRKHPIAYRYCMYTISLYTNSKYISLSNFNAMDLGQV